MLSTRQKYLPKIYHTEENIMSKIKEKIIANAFSDVTGISISRGGVS